MIRKVEKIKETVKLMLFHFPECRDSDNIITARIWAWQLGDNQDMALGALESNLLVSSESIRRARQLIQSKYPELQGEKRKEKMKAAQEMREEINSLEI